MDQVGTKASQGSFVDPFESFLNKLDFIPPFKLTRFYQVVKSKKKKNQVHLANQRCSKSLFPIGSARKMVCVTVEFQCLHQKINFLLSFFFLFFFCFASLKWMTLNYLNRHQEDLYKQRMISVHLKDPIVSNGNLIVHMP